MMAGLIPEEIVERIKTETDILDLVNEYVTLKKSGRNYTGLCPFHLEKTPSFTVVPEKGFFYCFGCGASGNSVTFVMRRENLDYPDALRFLARRAGITIPEKQAANSLAAKLFKAVDYAQAFFRRNLPGSAGHNYLKARGVDDSIVQELGLGFAPAGWDNLYNCIRRDNLPEEIFEKAGLLVRSDRGPGYYDKFRNRVIFPIMNISGRIVGFGGRSLNDEDTPKYLNSPETAIYSKGSLLYGLNFSKNHIREAGRTIVTEGYFDYISLYQAGIKNCVAMSGTGFTPNQAGILARFGREVVLLYDADSAGLKATLRAVDIVYDAGIEPLIARLPAGQDPDSFIRNRGADELVKVIGLAQGYLDFIRANLPDRFHRLPMSQQEQLLQSLAAIVERLHDPSRRDSFLKKAVEALDLSPQTAAKLNRREPVKRADSGPVSVGRREFESKFLVFLISNPEYIKESRAIIKLEHLREPFNQEVYSKLKAVETESFSAGDFLAQFLDGESRRRLTEMIVGGSEGGTADEIFSDFVSKFKRFQISDRLAEIRSEITKAEKEGELQKVEWLTREYRDLSARGGPRF